MCKQKPRIRNYKDFDNSTSAAVGVSLPKQRAITVAQLWVQTTGPCTPGNHRCCHSSVSFPVGVDAIQHNRSTDNVMHTEPVTCCGALDMAATVHQQRPQVAQLLTLPLLCQLHKSKHQLTHLILCHSKNISDRQKENQHRDRQASPKN